jgi:hypothetical protein
VSFEYQSQAAEILDHDLFYYEGLSTVLFLMRRIYLFPLRVSSKSLYTPQYLNRSQVQVSGSQDTVLKLRGNPLISSQLLPKETQMRTCGDLFIILNSALIEDEPLFQPRSSTVTAL